MFYVDYYGYNNNSNNNDDEKETNHSIGPNWLI